MSSFDMEVLGALRQQGLGPATILTAQMVDAPAEDMPIWACAIAATDADGTGTLRQLAAALPATNLNPEPGLAVLSRLARAIRNRDDYTVRREVNRIRHYAPNAGRHALVRVIRDLSNAGQIEPASADSARLFYQLHDLLRTKK
ncbi:hypothetical protein [Pontibaca methylaminivorans]|uniref:Uncharacterized protein n=1 Tax=Pontibaca methylaminivorans TaxID=515897 RepID=A0A1R3W9X4_9RHOB|nr:hypothetical protein [Pontibaca methylaminivorans]SIT74848.1 hypothetical protein SAMN05421849_0222 [Pontibaca methylaminivorans]